MKKNLKSLFAGMILSSSFFCFATTLKVEDVVNSKYLDELNKNKVVKFIHNGADDDYFLVPNCDYANLCKSRKIAKTKGNYPFIFEYIFLLDKKEILENNNSTKTDITINDISVLMRSASKMQGMKYYSNSSKKYKVLYEHAYTIDNPKDRNKIPDRIEGSTKNQVYYLIQDDASFGETAYSDVIEESENSVYAYLNNEDSLGMAFFKAINPGDLGVSIIAVDCGEKIVLYICMDANCKKYPNISNIMTDSLCARIEALKDWVVTMF